MYKVNGYVSNMSSICCRNFKIDAAQLMHAVPMFSVCQFILSLFQVSCRKKTRTKKTKTGKSACSQRQPYVLPAIPIEMSSLYLPEVHSSNLVKRIQGVKEKKKLPQAWGQKADGLTDRSGHQPDRRESEEEGIRKREMLHFEVTLGHVWGQSKSTLLVENNLFLKEHERLFNPKMRQTGQLESNCTVRKVPFWHVFITFWAWNAALVMIARRMQFC